MNIWTFIPQWVISSKAYYHLYYKHTAKHKRDLQDVYDKAMAVRNADNWEMIYYYVGITI